MSILSFVKFPYRMPDGFVPTSDFETKDIGFQMRWCEISPAGRLICEDDGDLNLDDLILIHETQRTYGLEFEAGVLKRIRCYALDGSYESTNFDATNYQSAPAQNV